jgi:DNA replication and repair protein RecF
LSSFGIHSLTLCDFRNFERLQLSIDQKGIPVVLISPNGSGKTNILEAISLFSPGKGLRSSAFKEMKNISSQKLWQIGMSLHFLNDDDSHYGMCIEHAPEHKNEKRLLKKEGISLKSTSLLPHDFNVLWLIPSMDRLISDFGQPQRNFLDRLIFTLDPNYAETRIIYDRFIKERNVFLKTYPLSNHYLDWLDQIEEKVAIHGASIYLARFSILEKLNQHQAQGEAFPRYSAQLDDAIINDLSKDRNDLETQLKQKLKASREIDSKRGITSIGPHRSFLKVFHKNKKIDGELCSTGEQKMLLLAIVLSFTHLVKNKNLLLLLDDVIDHLDDFHKKSLLEEIMSLHQHHHLQCWLTGNKQECFSYLDQAHYITPIRD